MTAEKFDEIVRAIAVAIVVEDRFEAMAEIGRLLGGAQFLAKGREPSAEHIVLMIVVGRLGRAMAGPAIEALSGGERPKKIGQGFFVGRRSPGESGGPKSAQDDEPQNSGEAHSVAWSFAAAGAAILGLWRDSAARLADIWCCEILDGDSSRFSTSGTRKIMSRSVN